MNYQDPNFNIILLSCARTGSQLLKNFFSVVTKVTPQARFPWDNTSAMLPKQILHSHNPKDILLGNEHTFYVVSTRNLIEATYSHIIGQYSDTWVYYNNEGEIKPFICPKEKFLRKYYDHKQFYIEVKKLLPDNHIKIDYTEFKDNYFSLFDTFKLSPLSYKFTEKRRIPTKTPGTYKDWIINFDEINEIAGVLDPNPPI